MVKVYCMATQSQNDVEEDLAHIPARENHMLCMVGHVPGYYYKQVALLHAVRFYPKEEMHVV